MPPFSRREVLLGGLALGLAGCTPTAAPTAAPAAPPLAPSGAVPTAPPVAPPVVPPSTSGATAVPGAVSQAPTPVRSRAAETFSVMTFNLLTPNLTGADFRAPVIDSEVRLSSRVPVMARWIRDANPDIIGLQENEADPPRRLPLTLLAPLLPEYEVIRPRLNVPLLVRRKAFAVTSSGALDITQGRLSRHVAWYRVRHRRTGQELLVANTHLDPLQKAHRASQRAVEATEVAALLTKVNPGGALPVVLLGDLNVRADETRSRFVAPLTTLAGAGLKDAADIAALDVSRVPGAASLNSFGAAVDGRWTYRAIRTDGYRYDYVLVSRGIPVRTWQVVTGPGVRTIHGRPFFADGPVPSDHCPVQAELEFPST